MQNRAELLQGAGVQGLIDACAATVHRSDFAAGFATSLCGDQSVVIIVGQLCSGHLPGTLLRG